MKCSCKSHLYVIAIVNWWHFFFGDWNYNLKWLEQIVVTYDIYDWKKMKKPFIIIQTPCSDTYAPICKIIGDQNKNTNQFTQKVF
jgi:hypothetical protein